MKVGICGRGPWAIELGLSLLAMGGMVRFYGEGEDEWGGDFKRRLQVSPHAFLEGTWKDCTSEIHRHLVWEGQERYPLHHIPTLEEYWQHYLCPLIEKFHLDNYLFSGKIIRVQKRFLHPQENILGSSRFLDLFRVVVEKSPEKLESGELNLSTDLKEDLESSYEAFDDVDVVIDTLTPYSHPYPMGAGGCSALGEKREQTQKMITYVFPWTQYHSFWSHHLEVENKSKDKKTKENFQTAFVGEHPELMRALIHWGKWVLEQEHPENYQVFHLIPFVSSFHLSSHVSSQTPENKEWKSIYTDLEKLYQKKYDEFLIAKQEWEELEDYIKVKKKRPIRPQPLYRKLSGFDVVSVDQLLDREGIFLTIERPAFRILNESETDKNENESENINGEESELQTLHIKHCFVGMGYREFAQPQLTSTYDSLQISEKGFFSLNQQLRKSDHPLVKGWEDMEKVILGISSLFSRKGDE